MPDFTPGETGTDEVLFARDGELGRVLLNRPKAINSLTREMVVAVRVQLDAWVDDDAVSVVSIEGAGDRGLCAGGDIRAVREAHLAGTTGGVDFWADEYVLDAQIAEYPKPVVAVMDGIVMGGGLGISMFADVRWVTERSKVAMPETKIGFFPDVAATYLLARTPGELGTHLAMTGATVTGADAVHLGLADAVVDSASLVDRLALIAKGDVPQAVPADARQAASALAGDRGWIDECYPGDDPAAILARLRGHADPRAVAAADTIEARSPLSVAVALETVRRAESATSVREVLRTDTIVSANLLQRPDFAEGVRALLVDKDQRPTWEHASLADVTRDEVQALFRPAG